MSYIINRTDGTILTEIVDGNVDQTSTDLTLIGKNASTYGELLNENFVFLLENFASTSSPNNPIIGQLWYDKSTAQLKVYDGSGFKAAGGTFVSNTVPTTLGQGDLWIDSFRQQLYFNDGVNTILAGPVYSAQQGLSGMVVTDVIDINDVNHTIVLVYVSQILIGLYSKDSFLPRAAIGGFSDTANTRRVEIGFNSGNTEDTKLHSIVTQAESLITQDGNLKVAEDFVTSSDPNPVIYGQLSIRNSTPLILGPGQTNEISVSSSLFQMTSLTSNQNFTIQTNSQGTNYPSIHIDALSQRVGIYTNQPTAMLDVAGNTVIRGNLTVEGTTTSISSTVIAIDDKNLELGSVNTPTDSTADGGGITLKGLTDKTFTWTNSNDSWNSSEHLNLSVGKKYFVNDVEVLSETALGTSITSALGLNSIGKLNTLGVGNLSVIDSSISFSNTGIINGDVTLVPKGSGSVNVSNKKIINLANPTLSTDAANVAYVDNKVGSAPLGLVATTTGLSNTDIINEILRYVYPPAERVNGTLCRILCTDGALKLLKIFNVVDVAGSKEWTFVSEESVV